MDRMNLDAARRTLEPIAGSETLPSDAVPVEFFTSFLLCGFRVDLNVPGRVICSFSVAPRFANSSGVMHGGMIASLVDVVGMAVLYREDSPAGGVTSQLNFSYVNAALVNEEIEIDARSLMSVKPIGVCVVELKNKKTGKIIAQARLSRYLTRPSKL